MSSLDAMPDPFHPGPVQDRQAAFLQAWKRGVALSVSPTLFGGRGLKLCQITHRKTLQPDIKAIANTLTRCSKSQGAFLVAMVSFYNPEESVRLCRKIGISGFGDLALYLSDEQRHVVAELLVNYTRW